MASNSAIEWTDHTFNPWWGCSRVSPGCKNCYAEAIARRFNNATNYWDSQANIIKLPSDGYWRHPIKWNKEAAGRGQIAKVFCGSMCDIFSTRGYTLGNIEAAAGEFISNESTSQVDTERRRVFALTKATPNLFWLLLTKRPENIVERLPGDWENGYVNVGLGVSVETANYINRIKILTGIPSTLRFLSLEPLLGPLPKLPLQGIDWVIVGGESGDGFRPMLLDWVRDIRDQCLAAKVPFFFKQLAGKAGNGELPKLDGVSWAQFPAFSPGQTLAAKPVGLPTFPIMPPALF
jgi:protein gp37